MAFYYISLFSIVPLSIAYGALLLVFWGIARLTRAMPARKALLGVVGAVFLVLPVAEELWIAWNFGQACKESGTFIYRKVQVEGFYDDTSHWWRQLAESKYQFVESREYGTNKYWRVERDGNNLKHFAIDRPTARYHFKSTDSGTKVAHKIVKSQTVVIDTEKDEPIARYTRYGRGPAWFFIALDIPAYACDAPGRWPLRMESLLVYRNVLIPVDQK